MRHSHIAHAMAMMMGPPDEVSAHPDGTVTYTWSEPVPPGWVQVAMAHGWGEEQIAAVERWCSLNDVDPMTLVRTLTALEQPVRRMVDDIERIVAEVNKAIAEALPEVVERDRLPRPQRARVRERTSPEWVRRRPPFHLPRTGRR